MHSSSSFFIHFAFSQVFLCTLLLVPYIKKNHSARLFALFTFCGCAYLLGNIDVGSQLKLAVSWFAHFGGNALPGVFWLVSLTVFADKLVLSRWHYLIASMTLLLPLFSQILKQIVELDEAAFPAMFGLFKYGSMMLELALVSHALTIALLHWRNDLVEERRLMRGSVIGFTATYLFAVIVLEQVIGVSWEWLTDAKFVALCVLTTGVNLLFFSLRENTLFAPLELHKVERKKPVQSLNPDIQKITHTMESAQLYREEGMTISRLSRHIGIHEYKLRQLINGELGYRNFNDFLNDYRIKDVTSQLRSLEKSSVPILTLALESGFRSLSSFNKVFKEKHGLTPSEYRNLRMNQSVNTD